MDLGYLEFSTQFKKYDYWQLKIWSAISIWVAKAVVAISQATQKDIVRHYPLANRKTVVIPLAYDATKFKPEISAREIKKVREKYTIVGDYLLYLGTLKPSKNLEGLIEALAALKGSQLVMAGKKGWLYDSIFAKVKELELEKRVIFTDYVPEEDKPALISGAKVFCLPSFWEGFGLDILNALACGVPVVVSDRGSLPEVAGEAGIYVDPNSSESIAGGIKKVLSLSELEYNKLVKKGLAQAAKFSWEETARQTLKLCFETGTEKS
jgi:glycosyltransferase involved in cell wall biosynthesis